MNSSHSSSRDSSPRPSKDGEKKPYTFGNLVEDYLDLKDEINQLEAQLEIYKTKIQRHLRANDRTSVISPNFKVEEKTITSKRMLKEFCPPEIWKQYSTETSHTSLYISRCINGKTVRGRSKQL